MGKRVYKKCISIFLVVCMLVSITPASTCQVKAAGSIDIMDITEKAGVFVRGGMNAYEQSITLPDYTGEHSRYLQVGQQKTRYF